jgi:hypothetical protein
LSESNFTLPSFGSWYSSCAAAPGCNANIVYQKISDLQGFCDGAQLCVCSTSAAAARMDVRFHTS